MFNLISFLQNENLLKYWAHINEPSVETLFEHTSLVKNYYEKIIDIHGLENVVNSLINDFIEENYNYESFELARKFIYNLFYQTLIYHDIGKLNPNFQSSRMGNSSFVYSQSSLSSGHSKISSLLYMLNFLEIANGEDFSSKEKIINIFLIFAFSFSILKHHSSSIVYTNLFEFTDEFIDDLYIVIDKNLINYTPEQIINIKKMINQNVLNNIFNTLSRKSFNLFVLMKLNYSLLAVSDYYATTHYMNKWKNIPDDFGVMDDDLKERIINNVENTMPYNKEIYDNLENYTFEYPQEANNENLNILRQNMSAEVIHSIRSNCDKNLFYLEAPTGGGKTNLSMLALAEFLKNDLTNDENDITKVFYVFPFTTLITQTFESLKNVLGVNNEEIVQIHSKTGFSNKNSDDEYGKDKYNIIDYQFINYPIALLSHIKFFDILKSNKKSKNYLLHRLANSIVIIDELQAYSPREWDKVIYFINNYAQYFNIKFLLMSATLPKIDELLSDDARSSEFVSENFVNLIKKKGNYFENPNFANRIEFDFNLLHNADYDKENREEFLNKLWAKIKDESLKYKQDFKLNRVHTIVEFIFKKTASDFHKIVYESNGFFDEIFVLSGTTIEPRRKEIISKLKSDSYQDKSILLITTQVVEAGVDIDMDLGFKDSSLIDSDEQLAGRINRNVKKQNCKLFIFDLDDAKIIYGKDDRYKIIQNELKTEYFDILKNKTFDIVYSQVMYDRNKHNKQLDYVDNLPSYIKSMRSLDFISVDRDFQLIDNSISSVTIFAPIKVPLIIPYSIEKNFNEYELEFLRQRGKYLEGDKYISGHDVWHVYENVVTNKDDDFVNKKIQIITMQGLLSKFSFSIGVNSTAFKKIILSGNLEEKYGFYYINNVDSIYDYKTGIKNLNFSDTNIW